ncbi:MAG: hypothetical protein K5663_10810 [Clostridiales bacterium]|nr:hypothetical protein [Clostridiales bacterium]
MLSYLFDEIEQWLRDLLSGMVTSNLTNMFTDVNTKTGEIAAQVGQTPQGWNGNIFSMIRNISNSVVIPIAGMIITFILCYELITMITNANNMHEIDTFMFFKYFIKMWVAVYVVSHTFDLVMAIFDIGQHVVNGTAGIVGSAKIDIYSLILQMQSLMKNMGIGELLLLALETLLVSFGMKIITILITVILYGRMIEIYLYSSIAAIPLATMSNKEWGQIGNNYIRGLLALAFQGFFMMICVAIYAVLVSHMTITTNIHTALFSVAAYTVLLCFALFKTSSLSKAVFNAH